MTKYKRFKEQLQPEVFLYKCDVPARAEDLPPFAKQMQSTKVERAFKKEVSVFMKWRADTPTTLQQAYNRDVDLWKGSRFIKVDEEVSRPPNA